MTDLAEFLLARIAEDEAVLVAVLRDRPDWEVEDSSIIDATPGTGDQLYVAHARGEYISRHIARWDPARVLAECETKRRLIELGEKDSYWDDVLRLLALPYADHPDYRDVWRS